MTREEQLLIYLIGETRGIMAKCSDIPDEEIIAICRSFHRGESGTPDEVLAVKYPRKVILAKMQKLVDRGVLECGVSLRTAWVIQAISYCKSTTLNSQPPTSG